MKTLALALTTAHATGDATNMSGAVRPMTGPDATK